MAGYSTASYTDKQTGETKEAGFRVCWRYGGKMYQRTVDSRKAAVMRSNWITERCNFIKQGLKELEPPQGADIGLWFMSEGKQGLPVDKIAENGSKTIDCLVTDYLASRKREVDAGSLSASSYSSDVYRLEEFKRHCVRQRQSKLSEVVTGEFLGSYRDKLLKRLGKGKVSAVSVKHVLRTVKACIKWGYKQEDPRRHAAGFGGLRQNHAANATACVLRGR